MRPRRTRNPRGVGTSGRLYLLVASAVAVVAVVTLLAVAAAAADPGGGVHEYCLLYYNVSFSMLFLLY